MPLQAATFAAVLLAGIPLVASGQDPNQAQTPQPSPTATSTPNAQSTGLPSGKPGEPGGETKAAKSSNTQTSASGKKPGLGPLEPSLPPQRSFSRPRIGLALGGGAALALTEVGVLEWFEENHVPVDVIAGTSMGCMVSALYSTGRSPAQLQTVMNDKVFASVFTFSNAYTSRSYRRREDARELPNGLTIGLKHGVSFRNALLTDQGLNAFLDREFLRYDDQTDFNSLPIPLRCMATDLNDAVPVTFSRGSLPDAVRASVSIPAVFKPFELNGHEYVDGGILENLPTPVVHEMQADVVLAVSLPLSPVGKGDLDSILGVVGRTAQVAIEAFERQQRQLANVVITPDISGFSANDYLKTPELAKRGYAAAEANRAKLLPYALSEADWQAYLDHRNGLRPKPAAPVLRVRVIAPTQSASVEVEKLFAPLVNAPVDTAKIEALLDQVRADGAYNADYTVGYETPEQFAAEQSGTAQLPRGTVQVPVALKTPVAPASGSTSSIEKPLEKIEQLTTREAATTSTPLAKSGAPDPSPVPAPTHDEPGASGMAGTLPVTDASLADVAHRPTLLVTVTPKKTGPPFLLLGANVEAQAGGITRATAEGIFTYQDFLSYGSELRAHLMAGYTTLLAAEYYHPLNFLGAAGRLGGHTVFVAPGMAFFRQQYPIFDLGAGNGRARIADRQLQTLTTGASLGITNQRSQQLRAGVDFIHASWTTVIGTDSTPELFGHAARAHLTLDHDTQDRALVAQFGMRYNLNAAYLFGAGSLRTATTPSPNAPSLDGRFSFARRFSASHPLTAIDPHSNNGHEILVLGAEGGTLFNRNVAQPFRYTLGGPLRLSASTIDQYRGTDYFLVEPAILRRVARLPSPLGQSIYLGAAYELGQMRAPNQRTLTRQDMFFGIVAETPLGVITLAPAIGTNGERKFIFTLGRLF